MNKDKEKLRSDASDRLSADTSSGLWSNVASGRNWFRGKAPLDVILCDVLLFSDNSRIFQYVGLTLLFCEEGEGSLIINGNTFGFSEGSAALLYVDHFFRFSTSYGRKMRVRMFRFSYSTYLLLATIPGYNLQQTERYTVPIVSSFSRTDTIRIRRIMSEYDSAEERGEHYLLLYEFIIRLFATMEGLNSREKRI